MRLELLRTLHKQFRLYFASRLILWRMGLSITSHGPGETLLESTTISTELAGKRLELLKEIVPKLSRVAVLWDPRGESSEQWWKESQMAARELGLHLHSTKVSSADKFEEAFREIAKAHVAALSVSPGVNTASPKPIIDLAAKYRLPAI